MNKAIFLDRDGVINEDTDYPHKIEHFILIPEAIEALKLLKDYKLFIISNQSGIGRGYYKEEDFHTFNNHLLKILKKENINITETRFCPHLIEDNCDCRKPNPKNLNELAEKYNIDKSESFVIGDHPNDILLGKNANIKSILVLTGHGKKHFKELKEKPAFIAQNILEAANWIIADTTKIRTKKEIEEICKELKKQGKPIVTTNGVFDILHKGHIKTFEEAKKQGDILIVGINSDASTKRLKGPERPINNEYARARMLASLEMINYIVVFEEDNPIKLLEIIKPDVHVKYQDYGKDMIEAETVKKYGGKIHLAKKIEGHSTTKIIEKLKK